MKKNKKTFIIIGIVSIVLIGIVISFFINTKKDSYTLNEKEWIEENKNRVIDISILSDIPILTYNGEGLLFSFLDDVNENLGLTFNGIAYKVDGNPNDDYVFKLVDKANDNDILILRDNYVLVMKDSTIYHKIDDIKSLKLGVLTSDLNEVNNYLDDSNSLTEFENISDLKQTLNSEGSVDGIIILKSLVMKELIENNLSISYQFVNFTKDYVLTVTGDQTLNSILNKEFTKWSDESYDSKYNENLLRQYFLFKKVSDSNQTNLKSKSYTYGFVKNGIFDTLSDSKLKGIDNLVLKGFTDFSGLSISYKEFDSISKLIDEYNTGNIDLFLNNTINNEFNIDSKETVSSVDSSLAIISNVKNDNIIDSIYSLNDKDILTIDSSKITKLLDDNGIEYKTYKNIDELFKNMKESDVIVLDFENYDYYKSTKLKNYKLDYIYDNNYYGYMINNANNNFYDLFNFYTNYTSINQIISDGYDEISYKVIDYYTVLVIVSILFLIVLTLIAINKGKKLLSTRKKKRVVHLSKADKLKYIDQLTSLKNRAYLNSRVDAWDNSEIYPQAIIIVDLNNIAYINDNYGREEGDRIIVEAANILIKSQLPNTEIIRTDGNEFLIYLVGYSERNVIAYLRSLSRELKKLSHGFGAASGYSMITNGIKTVDDAVNEATIDMKNNKEDIDY